MDPRIRRVLWNHHCLSVRLSVCPSVCQFGEFLKNRSLVFLDFLYEVRSLQYLKTDRAQFLGKIYFCPNLGKKGPKWPQNRVFSNFGEILSFFFSENGWKWKFMWFLTFQNKPRVWQNSGSGVIWVNKANLDQK